MYRECKPQELSKGVKKFAAKTDSSINWEYLKAILNMLQQKVH